MESNTSVEIIMKNTVIQQEGDACIEVKLKKGLGVIVDSRLNMCLPCDMAAKKKSQFYFRLHYNMDQGEESPSLYGMVRPQI